MNTPFRATNSKESRRLFFPASLKVQEVFTSVLTSAVPDSSGLKAKDGAAEFFWHVFSWVSSQGTEANLQLRPARHKALEQ